MPAPPPQQWTVRHLRQAMQTVLAAQRRHLLCTDPAALGGATPARASHHYPGGPHSHPFAEICIALRGWPSLDTGSQRQMLRPPRVAILPPGVSHCEGYWHAKRGYELLWLAGTGSSLLVTFSQYEPANGWRSTSLAGLQSPHVRGLFQTLSDGTGALGSSATQLLQARLLCILSELYGRAVLAAQESDAGGPRPVPHILLLHQVKSFLDEHHGQQVPVSRLAELAGLSPNYLNTLFRRWEGRSIHEYQIAQRMDQALHLCRRTDLPIKAIARRLGYDDPLYFSRAFHKRFGVWPSRYRASPSTAG